MSDLAALISEKTDALVQNGVSTDLNRDYNHASEAAWAFDCMRHIVLARMNKPTKEMTIERKRLMREGHRQEVLIAEELREAGLNIQFTDEKKRTLLIPGYELITELDAMISSGPEDKELVPCELKGSDPAVFRYVKHYQSPIDMLKSNIFYHRHYPAQLWIQMLSVGKSRGVWVFKDRSGGGLKPINCNLSDGEDYMNRLLDLLDKANAMYKQGTVPDPERVDACRKCDFHEQCFEGEIHAEPGEKPAIIHDENLEAKLTRWNELERMLGGEIKKAIKESEKLEDEIKDVLRGQNALVGDFKFTSKPYQKTTYQVPDEIRNKYAKSIKVFRTKIEYIGGTL